MIACKVRDCIHNSRGDPPECRLETIELNDRGRCVSFESDNKWLQQQFRHGYMENLRKAQQANHGKSQSPVAERAETLHTAARDFLTQEESDTQEEASK